MSLQTFSDHPSWPLSWKSVPSARPRPLAAHYRPVDARCAERTQRVATLAPAAPTSSQSAMHPLQALLGGNAWAQPRPCPESSPQGRVGALKPSPRESGRAPSRWGAGPGSRQLSQLLGLVDEQDAACRGVAALACQPAVWHPLRVCFGTWYPIRASLRVRTFTSLRRAACAHAPRSTCTGYWEANVRAPAQV